MKDKANCAWLVTPFAPEQILSDKSHFAPSDLIIAIDNGLSICLRHQVIPDILIGDMDSLDSDLLRKLPSSSQIFVYPSEKDETDTQLAVEYCLENHISQINILNDLHGRFDHALGIVQNLLQASRAGCSATIYSGSQMLFILKKTNRLSYPLQTPISLIAISEKAVFQSSSGLKYPLNQLTLFNWQSKGISNLSTASEVVIKLNTGSVLAVVGTTW